MRPGWVILGAILEVLQPIIRPIRSMISAWMSIEYTIQPLLRGFALTRAEQNFEEIQRLQFVMAVLACIGLITVIMVTLRICDFWVLFIARVLGKGADAVGQALEKIEPVVLKEAREEYQKRQAEL